MPIVVGPSVPEHKRTHHVSLTDKNGKKLGLILVDERGEPKLSFTRNPVDRTSFKTSSGSMAYSDFQYPYTPITQASWAGGRGSLNYEADATKFLDSLGMRTGRTGKVHLGPQEQYSNGYRGQDISVPGDVIFKPIYGDTLGFAVKFTASASYTAGVIYLLLRKKGTPKDITVGIKSHDAGNDIPDAWVGTEHTLTASDGDDDLSHWIPIDASAAVTATTVYWVEISSSNVNTSENCWEIGVSNGSGTTKKYNDDPAYVDVTYDLYYRVTPADTNQNVKFFEYRRTLFAVISGDSGAPTLWKNGDRGVADSNAGELNKLKDATRSWVTDQWAGAIVMVIAGIGITEPIPYRTIVSNTGTALTVSEAWTVQHNTTTEYVIFGSDVWIEITGHGLTSPVTDVLVTPGGTVYFAQGDWVNMRRMRSYNNAGAFTVDWAADSTNKAVFLQYVPSTGKIWKANNCDASGYVSVASADPVTWGTDLTFGTAKNVGNLYDRITGLVTYVDDAGDAAVWAGKETRPWVIPATATPYPISLTEMETGRSLKNCKAMMTHGVYLYLSYLNGLEQYYQGQLSDIGPNLDNGLPADRQGNICAMIGYPGRIIAAIDAGSTGYSCIMARENGGWHEIYRGPYGKSIKGMAFQCVDGAALNRLWIFQGNDLIWLPFPTNTIYELEDTDYLYTHEGSIELSRMHAGMMDTLKLVKQIKVIADSLVTSEQWIEIDYRTDDEENWTRLTTPFTEVPSQSLLLADASQSEVTYGLSGKRLMFRIRFYTTDAHKTPILYAVVMEVVSRISVKFMYSLPCRIADNDTDLLGGPDDLTADEKLDLLDEWIGDTASSMLLMESVEPNYDRRLVFLQPYGDRTKYMKQTPEDDAQQRRSYLITLVAQDA